MRSYEMINIEYEHNTDDEIYQFIDDEFNKFATKNEVICNYTPFNFVAREDNKIIGFAWCYPRKFFDENRVFLNSLIVKENYRNRRGEKRKFNERRGN